MFLADVGWNTVGRISDDELTEEARFGPRLVQDEGVDTARAGATAISSCADTTASCSSVCGAGRSRCERPAPHSATGIDIDGHGEPQFR